LRSFANAARQLGSSVAILSSAYHLRERLAQLLFLYHENAADLFPRKIIHIAREGINDSPTSSKRRRGFRRVEGKAQLHVPRPTVSENVDPETFPEQLEFLADEVTTFVRCLNEFPEFTDEAVNASILSFEGDLKVTGLDVHGFSFTHTGDLVLVFVFKGLRRYAFACSEDTGHDSWFQVNSGMQQCNDISTTCRLKWVNISMT